MSVLGALVGGAMGAFGTKPIIPELPTLDTAKEQQLATQGNLAALPGLENLASQTNKFNQQQVMDLLGEILPGFRGELGTASANTASLLKGEIPVDVQNAVQDSAAAKAFAGGFGGSNLFGDLFGRNLGLTSLQLQQQGLGNLAGLTQLGRSITPMFDYTTMFISPQQKLAFDYQQNLDQFKRNLVASQVAAAPDPATAALAQELDRMFNTFAAFGMGMAGGAMGGGGGGGFGGGGGGGGGLSGQSYLYSPATTGGSYQSGLQSLESGGGFGGV